MELEFIKSLAKIMECTGLGELEYKCGKENLVLKSKANTVHNACINKLLDTDRGDKNSDGITNINFESQNNFRGDSLEKGFELDGKNQSCNQKNDDESKLGKITSTMIGTFYNSPSPGEPSFIKVGDRVKKGQVVCIIESMKLMNEVKASFDCEIMEILVEDQEVVEFGQGLFRVKEFKND